MTMLEDFDALFAGRRDIYGSGAGFVVKEPLTKLAVARHLNGEGDGIGVFPLRQDGTVSFGAIDLDEPNFALAFQMAELLPGVAWVESSRSGNAHVWVFFAEPAPAWTVRAVLRGVTEALGRPDVEIFPKQDRLRDDLAFGNYINLPYHGDERPVLYGGVETRLSVGRFTREALKSRQSPERWERRARTLGAKPPEERAGASAFGERHTLHECAGKIYAERESNPLVEGVRDVVLFNFAKMVFNWSEIEPDEAETLVREVNEASLPPLPEREVRRIIRNVQQKQYTSTGCDEPLMADYVTDTCPIANGRV